MESAGVVVGGEAGGRAAGGDVDMLGDDNADGKKDGLIPKVFDTIKLRDTILADGKGLEPAEQLKRIPSGVLVAAYSSQKMRNAERTLTTSWFLGYGDASGLWNA